MKRFLSLAAYALLTATMTFSLAACGGSDDDEDKDGGAKETMTKAQVRSILLGKQEWTVKIAENAKYVFAFQNNSVTETINAGGYSMQTYESWDITPKKGNNYGEGTVVGDGSTVLFLYRSMKEDGFEASVDDGKTWHKATFEFKDEIITVKGVSFKMVAVEGGTFLMGTPDDYAHSSLPNDEKPQYEVTVGDFYIGETEVTQALWEVFTGPFKFTYEGDKMPAMNISYAGSQAFVNQLSELTGRKFRLPTEAEWEYAAKGGKKSLYNENTIYASGHYSLDWTAWYKDNSGGKPHEVATTKYGNELGLYDMSGNVGEWTSDHYSNGYQSDSESYHYDHRYYIVRGGDWNSYKTYCRVTARNKMETGGSDNTVGLRIVMEK